MCASEPVAAWNKARRDIEKKQVVCLIEVGICLCGYNFDARYLPSTEAVVLCESKFCGVGAPLKVPLGIYFRIFSSALDPSPAAGSHLVGRELLKVLCS